MEPNLGGFPVKIVMTNSSQLWSGGCTVLNSQLYEDKDEWTGTFWPPEAVQWVHR